MYHLICKDQEVKSEEENNGYVVLKWNIHGSAGIRVGWNMNLKYEDS